MTRFTETLLAIFTVTAIYSSLFVGVIPTPKTFHDEVLPVLPFWALVAFGAYALGTLGWGVFTFIDKEDKYKELLEEIKEAKTFSKKNGVDVE
ncbi:unnamed protein product [Kuraishia capsulata CBS 1993]|uniref:Dolichol-phosphate mannosyltransferase subunit 3 n=1 Tax=Kuraishia capsulata CBS 1993 TaxID=1382522 RepID=W6MV60_9ASCO|nr:uncharacterized protein KUCA_T00005775001 [Kuraishia capsulata CBS 1993]CDK29782.1 unnamed protein product [Kuraishia capsulata CBS 1993]